VSGEGASVKAYPESVERLLGELTKLPGIGPRGAERLVFHLLKAGPEASMALARALRDVAKLVGRCSVCSTFTETDPCGICADLKRDHTTVCVVEEPKDVLAIERAGTYKGTYHVLMGHIAPLEGVGPEALTAAGLVKRVSAGDVKEVILATNPTLTGDGTALWLKEKLADRGVKVTRLARGVSRGSDLEFASPEALADALSDRREM
jgi:recombination protein RecR